MIEFSPVKFLAVIFTPDFSIGDSFHLINLFKKISGNKFDGELFSTPIPQDAPAEIPRFILNSQLDSWKLEVTLERTNLIFQNPAFSSITDPDALNFGNFARELFREYKKASKIRIQRLALIIDRVAKIEDETVPQFIANTYCKDNYLEKPFNNTSAFELHSLKKYEFKKFDLNSWVRIKSAQLAETHDSVLLMINDINTFAYLEAPDENFRLTDIDRFFKNIPNHIEEILSLYFK